MRKKFLLVLAVIAILIGGFAIVVAMQPADYRVTRSASISAPPTVVFAQVNDFHNWEPWSPWAKLDPDCKKTFEGSPAGTGAVYKWAGNDKVGEGSMSISASHPTDQILINLEFIKPFASTCLTEFTFKPQDDQTQVTWTMSGRNNFIGKAFCMFNNMDKMVGGDFEKGLASMKTLVEAPAKK